MNYDFVAKRIYTSLKENNINFKEFYFIKDDDFYIYPERNFDFYVILVSDLEDNKKNNDLMFDLVYPLLNEYEIDVLICLYTEETFNRDSTIKNLSSGAGKKYVA